MHVIDFYDDPQGEVLRSKLPADKVPEFIKTAHFITEQDQDRLPDDVYALVMVDRTHKMRKFACVDKGNTALSVIYFLENRHYLPEEAQKIAAANLITACGWYDMQPPVQLLKAAEDVRIDVSELKKQIGKGKTIHVKLPRYEHEKEADLVGSEVMPKTASLNPYVDVDGKSAPLRVVPPARYDDEDYCLVKGGEARFPVRSYDEVQRAVDFFEVNGFELHPEDRRTYCIKLASRADALGIPISDGIRKYAGAGYAPDGEIKIAIHTRLQHFTEDGPERDLLKGLMEKRSSTTPEVFAEALRIFDETTGLDQRWDESVYDPYYSTYGFKKEATWSFVAGNDRITEDQLKALVKAERKQLKCKFGEELVEELAKRPREIFSSLPLDSKRIIMRMANDPQP